MILFLLITTQMIEFKLKTGLNEPDYIELNKLLKATRVCDSGAMANDCIVQGLVKLNGKIETRKRAKIRKGDQVTFEREVIKIN